MPKAAVPLAVAATLPATEALAAPAEPPAADVEVDPPAVQDADVVEASYYGEGFEGRPTASGEIFDPKLLTAAHKTFALGSIVQVTDATSGRSVTVRINDRGPFHGDRAIDLSEAAAERIGMLASGTGKVVLRLLAEA